MRRLPNSASACVPSLSSSSSGAAYARDFLRLAVPLEIGSASASALFEEDDRAEMTGTSSSGTDETDDRFDVAVVVVGGTGSGLRIFLLFDTSQSVQATEVLPTCYTYVFNFGSA